MPVLQRRTWSHWNFQIFIQILVMCIFILQDSRYLSTFKRVSTYFGFLWNFSDRSRVGSPHRSIHIGTESPIEHCRHCPQILVSIKFYIIYIVMRWVKEIEKSLKNFATFRLLQDWGPSVYLEKNVMHFTNEKLKYFQHHGSALNALPNLWFLICFSFLRKRATFSRQFEIILFGNWISMISWFDLTAVSQFPIKWFH